MISIVLTLALGQFCPSYTLSSSNNTGNCGVEAVAGTNPSIAQWQPIFQLVSQGPSAWGSAGPAVSNIGQGCGLPNPTVQVPAKFPCELLKAIANRESGWKQFCVPTTPSDQVGGASRTIISFDCGYGVGQVTSGMHMGEAPGFDRARVASNATYNLATGTQILAEKWRATACVGDNQPSIIEDWYTATWAYNGLAFSNNPNNPMYSSTRGVYRPTVGGAAPYQEKVFGSMEFPPGATYWTGVPAAYPRLSDIPATASRPNALPEPSCATPTSCASTRGTHVSSCFPSDAGTGGGGGTTGGGGGSATGGGGGSATGGGGGSTDAGTRDAGVDAGVDAGIDPPAVSLTLVAPTLGRAAGCGCDSSAALFTLITVTLLRRRAKRF